MPESPAQRALTASTVALAVAVVCGVLFLPPLSDYALRSLSRTVVIALALALAVLLHWVFMAIAARRMERSGVGWVLLAVLLFPIGGAAALILLGWLNDDGRAVPAPAPAPGGG